ncbi:type I methionyl aminopeptidase [Rhodobacteraceae bacterium F11138]|nr:type I methionyl aminopeptidase [Rhodobacteraceae bacterium F11138]
MTTEPPVRNELRGRLTKDGIRIYEPSDFSGMQVAGALAARILDDVAPLVHVGQTTEAIDAAITRMVEDAGAKSATIGYKGYQHASCISVNHVVCHGIPGAPIPKSRDETISKDLEKRRPNDTLKDGDILNIDVTVVVDGWFGDTSRMYVAGKPPRKAERLIQVTHDSLMKGIEMVKPGNTFGDIGHAIQAYVEAHRMSVVRDFCGHGLGRVFHAPPNVLHYGRPGTGAVLEEGMFFTIEPMVNLGRAETRTLADDWTAVTRDKSLSAQFEHSVGVTADGCEIFTLSPSGRFHPTYG